MKEIFILFAMTLLLNKGYGQAGYVNRFFLQLSCRKFVTSAVGAGTGALIFPQLSSLTLQREGNPVRPIIITSHSNETGKLALDAGWEVLRAGGSPTSKGWFGEFGCAMMTGDINPQMLVMSSKGFLRHEGIVAYAGRP